MKLESMGKSEAPQARAWFWQLVTLGQFLLALALIWQWLCASTYRLYLDERQPPKASMLASARQRFEVLGDRVEPKVLTTEEEHLSFSVDFPWTSQFRARAVPNGQAVIEIAVVEQGARRTLFRRTVSEATEIVQPLPPTVGLLELSNRGEIEWSDPRVVHDPSIGPWLIGLMALLGLTTWWTRRIRLRATPVTSRSRTVLFGGITAAVSAVLCLAVLEVGLRMLGDRLPSWIAVQRRNLGEFRADPRWQESTSYGQRLAPQLHTSCEWEHGDVVRMGFLPPDLVRHPTYRFPFITDADGFRNSTTEPPAPVVVAAVGDSFTDAMTLPAELSWPARLAGLLGVSVRNYGTAGFGPGQELLVLKDYVLARRPRQVVVGFFAGNDLYDAESFEASGWRGAASLTPLQGWKFKDVIARYDQFYVVSLCKGAAVLLRDPDRGRAVQVTSQVDYSGEDLNAPEATRPGFDRGLFSVPVAGRTVRFAFLPPYLDRLELTREQLQASPGWEVTRRSYQEMKRLVQEQGGQLVVAFIPSKAQVYLPLLSASFSPADLHQALRFCLSDQFSPQSLDAMRRNRLALNGLMRDFCAAEGIAFLDLTNVLQTKLAAGYNTYFPDDSHWNAAGHEAAASAIAGFMTERGL